MKRWVRAVVMCVAGPIAVISACGVPQIVREEEQAHRHKDAGFVDSGAGGTPITIGDGGGMPGCPSTCEELNANCGFVTDTKCGGVVECGTTCPAGEVCGGGGKNRCGTGMVPQSDAGNCTPSTCAELDANCGFVTDTKCGGVVDCGKCTGGTTCGFGGAIFSGTAYRSNGVAISSAR